MIRTLGFLAAIIGAVGCSGTATEPTAVDQTISLISGGGALSPRFVALQQAPREVLQIGLPEIGVSGSLLLEVRDGPYERYINPNANGVVLQEGLLHGIFGFGEGLMSAELSEPISLILRGRDGIADRFHTYLDGDDRTVIRTYRCQIVNRGNRVIQLRQGPTETRYVTEACQSLNQSFENLYWVDDRRGLIVQSRQWAGDNVGAFSTRRAGLQ